MNNDRFHRLLPIAGIISALLLGAAIFASGSAPQVEKANHAEVVSYYHDHTSAIMIANIPLALLSAFFLAVLLVGLRATLRSGEAGESTYSSLVAMGGTVLVGAIAVMGMVTAAVAGAANSGLSDDSILSAAILADYAWMPWLVGAAVTLLATGIGGLRTATLPKWIAWVSIVMGCLCLTGIGGIPAFMLMPLWILAISVVLLRRQSAERAPSASPRLA
ncbi:MAG: hypothetical protein KDB57_04610 [Solirubrobacterales bacterium]|nr:hypothetical protein [Solirubrobacterales bacterium]